MAAILALGSVLVALPGSGSAAAATGPGSLDPTFGTGGRVTTSLAEGGGATALARDGRGLVAAGGTGTGASAAFSVVRYTHDGSLDRVFGSGGVSVNQLRAGPGGAVGLVVRNDGRIIVAGNATTQRSASEFGLVRLTPGGQLDPTFGQGGEVTTAFPGDVAGAQANAIVRQPDGRLVVAGAILATDFQYDGFALARYKRAGQLDRSFGHRGRVVTEFPQGKARAEAVALEADGDIVAAGTVVLPSGDAEVAVAKYLPNGSLDPSFGQGGLVVTPFDAPEAQGAAVAVDGYGRPVVAGDVVQADGSSDFAVGRFRRDGTPDPTFGHDGVATAHFSVGDATGRAILLEPCSVIVVAGAVFNEVQHADDFALAAFWGNGTLDRAFGPGGTVATPFDGVGALGDSMADQPGHAVAVAGSLTGSGFTEFGAARYLGACS